MNNISRALAALTISLCATGPVFAQDTAPAPAMPSDQAMPPPAGSTVDMTGQRVYNSDGDWFGTVQAMSTDAHGQRLAAVTIEKRMGIRGTTVLFPVGTLQPREKGGYMTNLTGDQIKQLPKANATNTP
jgi:hypothetical protein